MARVALFLRSFGMGGVERVTLDLADAFARAGHQVDLLACTVGADRRAEVPASVRLVELARARRSTVLRALVRTDPRAALWFARRRIASPLRVLPALVEYLNADPPAAVLSAAMWWRWGRAAWRAAMPAGTGNDPTTAGA